MELLMMKVMTAGEDAMLIKSILKLDHLHITADALLIKNVGTIQYMDIGVEETVILINQVIISAQIETTVFIQVAQDQK